MAASRLLARLPEAERRELFDALEPARYGRRVVLLCAALHAARAAPTSLDSMPTDTSEALDAQLLELLRVLFLFGGEPALRLALTGAQDTAAYKTRRTVTVPPSSLLVAAPQFTDFGRVVPRSGGALSATLTRVQRRPRCSLNTHTR